MLATKLRRKGDAEGCFLIILLALFFFFMCGGPAFLTYAWERHLQHQEKMAHVQTGERTVEGEIKHMASSCNDKGEVWLSVDFTDGRKKLFKGAPPKPIDTSKKYHIFTYNDKDEILKVESK